jgi:hypothetical protein
MSTRRAKTELRKAISYHAKRHRFVLELEAGTTDRAGSYWELLSYISNEVLSRDDGIPTDSRARDDSIPTDSRDAVSGWGCHES